MPFNAFLIVLQVKAGCPLSGHTNADQKENLTNHVLRRQFATTPDLDNDTIATVTIAPSTRPRRGNEQALQDQKRFTRTVRTTRKRRRTTPRRASLEQECDYLAKYCMRAYITGKLCGRTNYYNYQNFDNYCLLDYVNCMERYELWQVVHMGECFEITDLSEYLHYPYQDDFFLDQYYVLEDA